MNHKSKSVVSIIGGKDGPTSIYIAGKSTKQPLKNRIRNTVYRYRRKKVEKTLVANTHNLKQVVEYARNSFGLVEVVPDEREYIEQQRSIREGLILQYKSEILGDRADISKPDVSSEKSIREYWEKLEARSEAIAELPDSVISMDFHLYKIKIGDDVLEIGVDYIWNIFGTSYVGNGKAMKQFKKISRDLYLYYGVDEDDIKNKTKRYLSLVTILSS